jgi:Ca-activated chloride channel family protein
MTKTPGILVAVAMSVTLTGCPAAVPMATSPGDRLLSPGVYGSDGGYSPVAQPTAAATTAPAMAPGGQTGIGNPVSGIGLSSFFDTYNFNFPVPVGQSLGAVANVSHKLVAPEGGKVYLQIGLQTTDQAPATRQPLNISFVFDKSGSMEGEKIAYARLAAKQMIDQLGEQDTFSLVPFSSGAATLIPPSIAVEKASWKGQVDGILAGGGTNIDEGLAQGYRYVQSRFKTDRINRVILMSDGEATEGVTDVESLAQRATSFAGDGVSLTTIGVGTGFNETFMTRLATAGKGTFYFVNSAEEANKAFAGEVWSLQRTVARNVKLAVNVADGVKVLNVYGHSSKTEGQSLNVDSNDLILSQSKVILLELQVPAGAEGVEKAIANVKVDFDDVVNGGHKQAIAEAKVAYTADAARRDAGMDSKIASSVIILQTASVLIRAAGLLEMNQRAQAKAELLQQYETLQTKAVELKDADLANEVVNLKQYLDRFEATDVEVLKKELQFDAFQKQQGKKKVLQPAA